MSENISKMPLYRYLDEAYMVKPEMCHTKKLGKHYARKIS